jgi:hypothetical protein
VHLLVNAIDNNLLFIGVKTSDVTLRTCTYCGLCFGFCFGILLMKGRLKDTVVMYKGSASVEVWQRFI